MYAKISVRKKKKMCKNRITNSECFMELRKKLDEFSLGRIKGAMENGSVFFRVQERRSFPAS